MHTKSESNPIAALPRVSLATLPTPLEEAPRLSEALGGVRVLFKRDDLTGFALGGNKVRKLEYLMGDVLQQGADVIVTGAGPQSNYLRTTAAAACKLGLDAVLVMYGHPPAEVQGNYLLDRLTGVEIRFTGDEDRTSVDRALGEVAEELRRQGRRPYVIPRGGASPLGSVGYVVCAQELAEQCAAQGVQVDHLVCAVGACGTLAGLWLGIISPLAIRHSPFATRHSPLRIWGISVSRPREECLQRILDIATETAQLLGVSIPPTAVGASRGEAFSTRRSRGERHRITKRPRRAHGWSGECLAPTEHVAQEGKGIESPSGPAEHTVGLENASPLLTVLEDYLGPGYGIVTPEAVEAIRLTARTEGIFLDPVYTGKAMAGLIDLVRRGEIRKGETVVFLHTGGQPGLFAHAGVLSPQS